MTPTRANARWSQPGARGGGADIQACERLCRGDHVKLRDVTVEFATGGRAHRLGRRQRRVEGVPSIACPTIAPPFGDQNRALFIVVRVRRTGGNAYGCTTREPLRERVHSWRIEQARRARPRKFLGTPSRSQKGPTAPRSCMRTGVETLRIVGAAERAGAGRQDTVLQQNPMLQEQALQLQPPAIAPTTRETAPCRRQRPAECARSLLGR